ncbi:hypothetical protein H5410_030600 [Solanum commersonii]|uniref:Uncharacterized protein n=1 Tax=Solanum commersonii TaxID=4109 RepID=A0A9J5YJU1_SOLCO|nr:hypothetical protein H5410_030600 [Solanum commersonii]
MQKIEIPEFYARKQIIGIATILNDMKLLCKRTNYEIFKFQRNQRSRYGRNTTIDTELIKTRKIASYKSNTKEFHFARNNVKLLQSYRTQIPKSSMSKMLWRRQRNSRCPARIKTTR